jgi:catechol 2,3-dioxygenase-like lactoylglutathione lyase family enzyme
MRTLHVGLRVGDLNRSLAFYTAVGYTVVGTVEGTASGSLTMLRLPGDGFDTEVTWCPDAGDGAWRARIVSRADAAPEAGKSPWPSSAPARPSGSRSARCSR